MTKEEKSQYDRVYYLAHQAERRASRKARREANPDAAKANDRAYYARHREKLVSIAKVRYRQHIDRNRQWHRDHYLTIKDRKSVYNKCYHALNASRFAHRNSVMAKARYVKYKDKYRLIAKRYYSKNKERWSHYQAKRRALKLNTKSDDTVRSFYSLVRSKARIQCYYCGKLISGKEAHIDHVIALSKLGNHASDNLCASCPQCNLSKNNKLLTDWVPPTNQPVLNL